MNAALYYFRHAFWNSIKKLFRSWVAFFILGCVLIGMLVGVGVGILGEALSGPGEEPGYEEGTEEDPAEEDWFLFSGEAFGAVATGILLFFLFMNLLTGEKSGSTIFQMADVNLLFPSPMRPPSLLFFRLFTQMGASLFWGLYFLMELPILFGDMPIPALGIVGALLACILLFVFSQVFSVFLYTLASRFPKWKRLYRPTALFIVFLLPLSALFHWQEGGGDLLHSLLFVSTRPYINYLPGYGWIRGLLFSALQGEILLSLLYLFLVLGIIAGLLFLIYRLPADFYEEALSHSSQVAELQEAAETAGSGVLIKREKPRSEKIDRRGIGRGEGASVFFFKSMYNRRRLSYFGFLTKTMLTYLLLGGGTSLILRITGNSIPVLPFLVIAVLLIFRSMGNPLSEDTSREYFMLIPESPYAKVLYCELAGSLSCLMDLLPAVILICLLTALPIPTAIAGTLFLVTLDFYFSNCGVFVDFALSTGLPKQLKSMLQILLFYASLLPEIFLLVIGIFIGMTPALVIASLYHVLMGGAFFAITPLFLLRGRR